MQKLTLVPSAELSNLGSLPLFATHKADGGRQPKAGMAFAVAALKPAGKLGGKLPLAALEKPCILTQTSKVKMTGRQHVKG